MHLQRATFAFAVIAAALALPAQTLPTLRAKCEITPSTQTGKFSLHVFDSGDCPGGHHCDSNFDNESTTRFTGITLADLEREGAKLTATISAEAGAFTCTGTVHDQELYGDALFTPDSAFVDRMAKLGFTGYDSRKLEAYAFVNVTSEFAHSLQQAQIQGVTTDNLIALRIFNIDPAYAQGFVTLGYGQPDADKLIALKVQGVNEDFIKGLQAAGFKPDVDEVVAAKVMGITPQFIELARSHGFKNLDLNKLIQLKHANVLE